MPSRPIFVLGSACSGSTILSWGLAQHPHLIHALETKWLVTLAGDLESLHASSAAQPGSSHVVATSMGRSRFYETFGTAIDALFLSNGASAPSPRRWVDCTAEHAWSVAGLLRLFPQAKFIHVLRDVRAVVSALVHRPGPNGSRYTEKTAYEYWLRTSKAILEAELAFGPDVILRVPYADLLRDPERTLRRCLQFVDEPFRDECLRPFNGVDTGALEPSASYVPRPASAIRDEAELFSDLLLSAPAPNAERIARLDEAFGRRARRRSVDRGALSLVQRVQEAVRATLPPDARVIVVSKGDDELLKLDGRQASHFPQNEQGIYAGFYPADSAEAIAHLTDLRKKGHDYFLIPGPYFWWLEHYAELAEHLHTRYRVVYYQEDSCVIFALAREPQGWATNLRGRIDRRTRESRRAETPSSPPGAPKTAKAAKAAKIAKAGKSVLARAGGTPGASRVITRLARKLWGGFSTYAKADLEQICQSVSSPTVERVEAAWELAKWYAVRGEPETTLGYLQLITGLDATTPIAKRQLLLEVRMRLGLGQVEEATSLIAAAVARYGYDTDLCLLSSNALIPRSADDAGRRASDGERLRLINRIFARHGLHAVREVDPHAPLAIGNITSAALERERPIVGPKISVVIPIYNAAETIGVALAGLREQTWRNLEILVVDDASTDHTREVVSAIAALDERIKVIGLDENVGTYVARNKGLEQATGEYLTVHDADDWSHAQKLEMQITHLLERELVGTVSCWVRASSNLQFNGAWRPGDQLMEENFSSLMLRMDLMRELGGWDPVRIGADAELRRRIEAKVGVARVPTIMTDVPLSFALDNEGSLTRRRATHLSSLHFGVRHTYRRCYERWHAVAAESGDWRVDPDPSAPRKYPAPAPMLSGNTDVREYDVIFVCDLAMTGGSFVSIYHYVLAALKQSLRVGLFHWRRYDLDTSKRIDERLATLVDQFKVDLLVPDQQVRTTHLIFYYPPVLRYKLDGVPAIAFDHMYVIVNQMADRLYSGGDPQYDPVVITEHLESLFGSAGAWFGISPLVRALMLADPRYPRPGETIWTPLLETETWCDRALHWRGAERATPVIGRHGRDAYTKWPRTREAIELAYCVRQGWETRFLGGAEHAVKMLGGSPAHWTIWSFDAVSVREFLESLDILVHFPHEDYIEEFGRVVMEAMAVGLPVILPSRFAGTFGDAAVYCEPSAVADHITELWSDEQRYLDRARAGREFVIEHCAFDQLGRRLHQTSARRRVASRRRQARRAAVGAAVGSETVSA